MTHLAPLRLQEHARMIHVVGTGRLLGHGLDALHHLVHHPGDQQLAAQRLGQAGQIQPRMRHGRLVVLIVLIALAHLFDGVVQFLGTDLHAALLGVIV